MNGQAAGRAGEDAGSAPTVLALGAHPDDLELGCGATLAKLAAARVAVHAMVFTAGRKGASDGFDRTEETRRALAALGVARVVQHVFTDTRLHQSLNEIIAAIEAEVEAVHPGRVYTMFDADARRHGAAAHLVSFQLKDSDGVGSTQVWAGRGSSFHELDWVDEPQEGRSTSLTARRVQPIGGGVGMALTVGRSWYERPLGNYQSTRIGFGLTYNN